MAENNEESIRKESEARDGSAKSAKRLTDALEDLIARSKSAEDKFKTLNKQLDTGRKKFSDIAEDLQDLRETIEEVTDAEKKKALMAQLEVKESKARSALLTKAAVDGMAGIVGGLTAGVAQVSKSLINSYQSNAGAFDMAGSAMIAGIDATYSTTKTLAATATAVGGSMALIPGWTQVLGAAMALTGQAVNYLTEKLSDSAKTIVNIGIKELEATSKFYTMATSAGALFASGLTQFRNTATDANLTQGEFAKVLGENNYIFAQYGGTVANGAKTFSNASKAMEPFRKGLLNLGYSFEDQAQGLAQVMELNALSGQANRKSATDLAKETDSYLTNLRAISAFTGEDAKKAQARAREASVQAAVQAKLSAMDAGARERFQSSIKMLPVELQKAAQQMLVAGTVTDPEMAAALSNNAAAMEILRNATTYTSDATLSAADVTNKMKDDFKRLGPELEKSANALGNSTGIATLLTGQFAELSKITEALQQLAIKSKNIDKDSNKEAENLKNTTDPLTQSFADANIAAQDLRIEIQKELTPAITGLASAIKYENEAIVKSVRDLIRKMGGSTTSVSGGGGEAAPGTSVTGEVDLSGPVTPTPAPTPGGKLPSGQITANLTELLKNPVFSGLRTTSLNDGEHKADSRHYQGKAADFSVKGLSAEEAVSKLSAIQSLKGVNKDLTWLENGPDNEANREWAKSIIAAGGQISKYRGSAPHIHMEMLAKGGITDGLSLAGEAGPEAVVPLPDGRTIPVKMDTGELGSKMDTMIALLRDQLDNSGRMLHAIQ